MIDALKHALEIFLSRIFTILSNNCISWKFYAKLVIRKFGTKMSFGKFAGWYKIKRETSNNPELEKCEFRCRPSCSFQSVIFVQNIDLFPAKVNLESKSPKRIRWRGKFLFSSSASPTKMLCLTSHVKGMEKKESQICFSSSLSPFSLSFLPYPFTEFRSKTRSFTFLSCGFSGENFMGSSKMIQNYSAKIS